jgi:septation ring formation regulator EzrA
MFQAIANDIIDLLNQLDAIVVIGVFALLLVSLFGVALVMLASGKTPTFTRSMPTLLTTLGILGTFLGIAIGLLQFDVHQVEYSIPILLDGLKLAFITSIMGIFLGICLRVILTLNHDATQVEEPTAIATQHPSVTDYSAVFERQIQLAETQMIALQQLGDQLGQFDQKLTTSRQQQHSELLTVLEKFTDQLTELGSRQLIIALESVIRDFNTKLGEQFGENFRRLDDSVGKLLQWQDQYRHHMDQLSEQLDHATDSVAKSETTLQALTQQALQISNHVQDQQAVLASLRRETMELESLLSAIAELRDKAKDAFPAMDNRLATMLETLENAVLAARHFENRLIQEDMDTLPGERYYNAAN